MTPHQMRRLLARFLTAKEAAGRSRRTTDWYEDLNTAFIQSLPEHFSEANLTDLIENYQMKRRGMGISASTVAAEYRAVRAWLRWCAKRELLKKDPTRFMETPKVPDTRPQHPSPNVYFRLMDYFGHQIKRNYHRTVWLDFRDRLIYQVLFLTGLRITETISILTPHIDIQGHLIRIPKGKGDKDRDVPLSDDLATSVVEYIQARPRYGGPELFISANGHGDSVRGLLTVDGVRQMMKRRSKDSGTPYMSPHKWRHAYGMWTLNSHIDPTIVSKTMGHANVDFTMKYYARWMNNSLHEAYTKGLRQLEEMHAR